MMRATFCLQPGGDSPYRKSVFDAALAGGIPVVFSQQLARVAHAGVHDVPRKLHARDRHGAVDELQLAHVPRALAGHEAVVEEHVGPAAVGRRAEAVLDAHDDELVAAR